MSHNKITVAGQQPDSSGNVSVSIDNLADTNFTSLSTNEVVKWDGSQWVNGTAPVGTGEYIQLGRGETDPNGYRYDPPYSTTKLIYFYDTSPVNTIANAQIHQIFSNYYYRITLPAGKYMIMCQTRCAFSSSGYLAYTFKTNNKSTVLTATAIIGDNTSAYSGGSTGTINSFLELSSSTYLELCTHATSGVNTSKSANTGILDAFTYVVILKV